MTQEYQQKQQQQQEPANTGQFDVSKLDPVSQKAFQYAVDFYEKDHTLTPNQRGLLASAYSSISSTTMIVGWGTFFAVTAMPFYWQKLRTGSTKGINGGMAIIFGMGGMTIASPYGAAKSYNWQLEKLKQQDSKCYEVAQLLKPGEASKWWMYYKLTKDHPEHIMKDPRSAQAEEQRRKTIYSGRDPIGLYSGPRHEMNKRRIETLPDASDVNGSSIPSQSIEPTIDDEDPFVEKGNDQEQVYSSAWDKVRHSNDSVSTSQSTSSWGKLRSQSGQQSQSQPPNPYTTNVYSRGNDDQSDELELQQSEFDKLLEQERHVGEEDNKRW